MEVYTTYRAEIEFRYTGYNSYRDDASCVSKIITLGTFENKSEAIEAGNAALVQLEKRYPLNKNYNRKCRFTVRENLISNLAYLKTPFDFYAKIVPEKHIDINTVLDDIQQDLIAVQQYRLREEEE